MTNREHDTRLLGELLAPLDDAVRRAEFAIERYATDPAASLAEARVSVPLATLRRVIERCAHGKPFGRSVECLACDLIWHEKMLADAERQFKRHTRRVAEIRAAIALAEADQSRATAERQPSPRDAAQPSQTGESGEGKGEG